MNKILQTIHRKLALGPVLDALDLRLSLSELNSFLLELFRRKTAGMEPARLLREFGVNRFVQPGGIDPRWLLETELDWLRQAGEQGFQPLTLSPLAPLGTCSVVGRVDQNQVVSAVRGTEVVSDATNVLALRVAEDFKKPADQKAVVGYAAAHRHVRGQFFDNPNYTAHFAVFCLASGGWDTGHFAFELARLNEHLSLIHHLLARRFPPESLFVRFYLKKNSSEFREKMREYEGLWQNLRHEFRADEGHEYYDLIQFKVFLSAGDREFDLADGGPVDWTRRLLSNRKHRLFISGIGTELVYKLSNGLLEA